MKTTNELKIDNLSYTKRDFYQVYPELVDLVKKITDKWDPASSNESDPGNALLKVMSSLADKLNYNIDKKLLERFPTSVTEESSMRKLCEMLVYDMHYYKSATSTASFMWTGDELNSVDASTSTFDPDKANNYISLPAFKTILTNDSEDIQYILIEPVTIHSRYEIISNKKIIEGELIELEVNADNVLRSYNLNDKHRFYLPETGIAENGIYITSIDDPSISWERKQNLNTVKVSDKVWKFGFDSKLNTPYIEFADNILELIGNGLKVYYIRTSGASGNISAQTLTKLKDTTVQLYKIDSEDPTKGLVPEDIEVEDKLVIQNAYSTINGMDKETIDEAYENYKKTIGTFDTLVTCRDYANAIYQLVLNEQIDNTPLVSNCQVTDIRTDVNRADTVVSYDNYGVKYEIKPLEKTVKDIRTVKVAEVQNVVDEKLINIRTSSGVSVVAKTTDILTALYDSQIEFKGELETSEVDSFDLILYPLQTIKNTYSKETYQKSFKPDLSTKPDIEAQIEDYKTIAHKIVVPDTNDLYLIKNYYKLYAKIVTTTKVNKYVANQIKNNIYTALFKNFNSRQLEYGEEIPYDSLLDVMLNADERIKDINLDEPEIITKYMLTSGEEGLLTNDDVALSNLTEEEKQFSKNLYQKLVAKNVLAGKIPLFNYNNNLNAFYGQSSYDYNAFNPYNLSEEEIAELNKVYGSEDSNYTDSADTDNTNSITNLSSDLALYINHHFDTGYKLRDNEKIQLIAPKLVTKVTYPMYVNYFFKKADATEPSVTQAVPCTLIEINEDIFRRINAYAEETIIDVDHLDSDEKIKAAYNKSFTWLINNGRAVYRRGNQNIHTPGYLVDKEGYEYTSLLAKKGTLYKSITEYNNNYHYYTDTDLRNSSISGSQVGSYCLVKCDPRTSAITSEYYVTKADFFRILTLANIQMTEEDIFNQLNHHVYASDGSALGYNFTLDGYGTVSNVAGWESQTYTDTSDVSGGGTIDVERTENIPVYNSWDFKIIPITIGVNEGVENAFIQKDVDYALRENDALYINLTDNNSTTICRKYYIKDGVPTVLTFKNGKLIVDSEDDADSFNGIIRPNFDLYDSTKWALLGHSFAKSREKLSAALPTTEEWNDVSGMFSLNSSEEIAIRDFSKNVITKSCYLYWMANKNNTLQFSLDYIDPNDNTYGYYSCILEDNEALFYTDPSKSYLTTFGSGTKLTLRYPQVQIEENPSLLTWSLNENNSITQEDVALNGLGAFANNDWISKPNGIVFDSQIRFIIQQMTINTAITGDIVSNINLLEDPLIDDNGNYINSSKWWKLNSTQQEIIKINDSPIEYLNVDESQQDRYNFYWSIKPVLQINLGPNLTQTVTDYYYNPLNDESYVISSADLQARLSFNLYTSYFLNSLDEIISNNDIKEILEYDYNNVTEKLNPNPLNKFTLKNTSLRSNYLIQKSGGEGIDVTIVNLNGVRVDDLIIYPFVEKDVEITNRTNVIGADSNITIDFNVAGDVKLPLFVPTGHKLIFALYYNNNFTGNLKLASYQTAEEETTKISAINFYNDSYEETKDTISLQAGLNVILVSKSCTLEFESASETDTVNLLDPTLIKTTNNPSGVNLELLNLKVEEVDHFLNTYINKYKDFYYNISINNERYIDVKTMDNPYSWFNKKNVCNHYVISEIDVSSLSQVDIVRNSRLD